MRAAGRLEQSCADVGDAAEAFDRFRIRMHGVAYRMHRHDTYAVGVTLSGVQAFWFRGERRFSIPGQALVIHPDERHDGSNGDERPLLYDMLYITPAALSLALPDQTLPFVPGGVRASAAIREVVADAFAEFPRKLDELETVDLLARLAAALRREAGLAPEQQSAIDWKAVRLARDVLDGADGASLPAARLEALTGVDRYRLARHFRAAYSTSPHQYLVGRRVRKARRLIPLGRPLADIATACGFADQSHLTRHFLQRFGMTPGQFRAACEARQIIPGA